MCRSADVRFVDRDKIKIRAFCVRLTLAKTSCTRKQLRLLPDSLTLVYLPRLVTGSCLEIDGSDVRPDSPAFVTLHRVVSRGGDGMVVAYVSKERVRAGEGVRYEVYLGDVKLLNGGFRRGDEDEWRMGCRCLLEEVMMGLDLVEAEVCVAVEGRMAVCEKVEMVVRPRRRRRKEVMGLEEIPETKEEEECSCCCSGEEEEESGGDGEMMTSEEEEEMEGVGWAVDVGLWVMCLGVGLLVSKASSKRLRRTKFF